MQFAGWLIRSDRCPLSSSDKWNARKLPKMRKRTCRHVWNRRFPTGGFFEQESAVPHTVTGKHHWAVVFPAAMEQKGKVSHPSFYSITNLCELGSQNIASDALTVMTTFWDVTPCRLVEVHRSFAVICCLSLHDRTVTQTLLSSRCFLVHHSFLNIKTVQTLVYFYQITRRHILECGYTFQIQGFKLLVYL